MIRLQTQAVFQSLHGVRQQSHSPTGLGQSTSIIYLRTIYRLLLFLMSAWIPERESSLFIDAGFALRGLDSRLRLPRITR